MATPFAAIVRAGGRACLGPTGRAAIVSATGDCCLSPGVPCIPGNQSSCPCAVGCTTVAGIRKLQRESGGTSQGGILISTEFQVPYSCCCGGLMVWSIDLTIRFYDKRACTGQLCLVHEIRVTGSGVGPGTVMRVARIATGPDCTLTTFPPTFRNVTPICGRPGDLLRDAVLGMGLGFPITALNIPSLWNDGIHPTPEYIEGSRYEDCTYCEVREVASASLGSSNPCAGIQSVSIGHVAMSPSCSVSGGTCGACCCKGVCYDNMPVAACTAMGGSHRGVGTACNQIRCNPFGGVRGKCCLLSGVCSVITEASCSFQGGNYFGDYTNCSQPPKCIPATGACCDINGNCSIKSQIDCARLEGSTWRPYLDCSQVNCFPPDVGICCTTDGTCLEVSQGTCAGIGGLWRPGFGQCASGLCTGACCSAGAHGQCACQVTSIQDCSLLAGCGGAPNGVFIDFGSTCSPNPCVEGLALLMGGGGGGGGGALFSPLFDNAARMRSRSFGGFRGGCSGCGGGLVIPSPNQVARVRETRSR